MIDTKAIPTAELDDPTSAQAVLANADALQAMVAAEATASEQEGRLSRASTRRVPHGS